MKQRTPITLLRRGRRAAQAGFSLVELMVAITIALFMAAAVGVIYLNVKNTYNAQNGLAQLQDSERLALTMLTTTVQSTGYFVNPLINTADTALPAGTVNGSVFTNAGQAIVGTGNGTGSGVNSDTLAVQYQTASGDGLMNCQGDTNTSGSPVVWTNQFSVDANNELTCTLYNGSTLVGTSYTPLVGNVYAMNIQYGVDTDGDGNVDTYVPASAISAANAIAWSNVYTVRITLQFLDPTKSTPTALPSSDNLVQTIELMNRK